MEERKYTADEVAAAFGTPAKEVSFLGTGAFGETWRVGPQDACKIIYQDEFPAERLDREVEGLLKIEDDRVVRLRERTAVLIEGCVRQVLRFEFIPGGDLRHRLNRGQVPAEECLPFTRGLLHAAAVLHEAQVVHRDIKPENILLRHGEAADPVLVDLGLVKPLDESTLTVYPSFIGTARYAAPEQLRGDRARNAADLWSIGAVAAEALTGRHPYSQPGQHRDFATLLRAAESVDLDLHADTPSELRIVIAKLLSPRRSARGSARTAERMLA
ncbi:serine/threonine-protein kinase [Amycolatopsis sp. WQ 127309]|uniref:serine/threonine-protein kinase n=1 Tax=Amycolatopsis sp. WQ 127309 TaxID=2932773 RepID=UPI001FF5E261|nr:serine/threonine-protein kinase [Amycolatopsis sp. WQ 127309]UOZ03298.1 serine/threonine protein kinase [Amycolatopsis sp. WQ 127309]